MNCFSWESEKRINDVVQCSYHLRSTWDGVDGRNGNSKKVRYVRFEVGCWEFL